MKIFFTAVMLAILFLSFKDVESLRNLDAGEVKLENRVISDYVISYFKIRDDEARESGLQDVHLPPLVIFENTLSEETRALSVDSISTYQLLGLKSIDKGMIEDFNTANKNTITISKIEGYGSNIKTLSYSKFKEQLSKPDNKLYSRYADRLIFGFSRPGFNKSKDKAIINHITKTSLGDYSVIAILTLINNKWVISETIEISKPVEDLNESPVTSW